jgi:CubicO group peptidase (beta-lactamase class C family)
MQPDVLLTDQIANTAVPALSVGVSVGGTRSVAGAGRFPVTADSTYRIASLTKPFTSAAVVLALAERAIPLSTAAIQLLPALESDWQADRSITVAQLLAQVSGLRESVDATTMASRTDGPHALQEAARMVVKAGNDHGPGERWSYYNGNYFLMGAMLAAVTRTSYEDALARTLLDPWKLTRTGFDTPAAPITGWDDQSPLPIARYPRSRRPSGGLWSCVADLLGFAEHLLDDEPLLEETRRPRTRPDDAISYGLGWAVGPSGQLYLNGRLPGYRAVMLVLPDRRYASVTLANRQQALPEIARLVSDLQQPLTGDDVSRAIVEFAA